MKNFYEDYLVDLPLYKDLLANFYIIKNEVLSYINNENILYDYPKYKVGDKCIYENYWKATPITIFKEEHIELSNDDNQKQLIAYLIARFRNECPVLYSLIRELEDTNIICNGFISRLMPGSIINPHGGWSNKYLRTHLCLVEDSNCFITINGETRVWKEGCILAFKDGNIHSVIHKGIRERIIVSIDIDIESLKKYGISLPTQYY